MSAPLIAAGLLGVGILGYWLLGPKKSPTQKPDRMPALNQSMRGATVCVSFGANRISAQIGWNKNFRAVRNQPNGKKGGSGGFGSMKGGTAAQSYIYKWDMIFNYGIVDKPSYFRRGWIGGDLIQQWSLPGGGADAEAAIAAYGNFTVAPDEQTAALAYEASHVNHGYPTGSASLQSWAYFQAQEGVDCAWPYNFWVGFEQYNLGQSPSVPQIALELVPIPEDGGLIAAPSFDSSVTADSEGFSTLSPVGNCGIIYGENGKHYYLMTGNTDVYHFVCVEDGTHLTLDTTQFRADLTTKGMTPPSGTVVSDYVVNQGYHLPANGTPYCWIVGTVADGGLGFGNMGIRYKINSSGALQIDGGISALSDFLTDGNYSNLCANVVGTNVVGFGTTTFSGYQFLTLPLAGDVTANGAAYTALFTPVSLSSGFFDYIGGNRVGVHPAAIVVQPDHSYKLLAYIGQGEYDYVVANPSHSSDYSTVTATGMYDLTSGTPTLLTDFSITDVKVHLDGTPSSSYYDDYASPTSYISGGVTYVQMARGYSLAADNVPLGTYGRVRVWTFDGTNASQTALLEASLFDPVANLGFTEANRYTLDPPIQIVMWADATGVLNYIYQNSVGGNYRNTFGPFASNGGTFLDVTPAYIAYRILTSDVFGFATSALFGFTITEERVNQDSYQLAQQWCVDQGIRVSVAYVNGNNVLPILEELLSLFNGFLTDLGGEVYFNFVTGTETPVRTIDNSHLVADAGKPPVKTTKAATDDGYNIIQFQYLDRNIEYKTNMVEESDEVDIDYTGPRLKQYSPTFTMAGSVATVLARRALWQNLFAKDTYAFKLGWKDADLHQGVLVTLVDSFDPTLANGVRARILKWKEEQRGQFTVTAVREFPYIMAASASYTQTTSMNGGFGMLVQTPTPMLDFRAYELPKEFQTKPQLYFGYNQGFYNMGAQLYLSHDGANYVLTQDVQPYIISGLFPNTLEQRPQGYAEEFVDFYLFPTSQTSSPTFVFSESIDDVSQALRAAGAGVFIVGSEAVAVENLTLLGENHYRARRAYRGWGGTPITAHPANALWHYHAAGMFAHDISLDDIGTTISYKMIGYSFAGEKYDLSSVDARTYTIRGDYWLPRAQPRTRLFVNSAQSWPASTEVTGPYIGVVSGGCDVALTWPNQANDEGFGAGGYGGSTYGHFAADSLAWRVDVQSINGTKVSSFVANTPYFDYTMAQNSADFGGFGRDLILTVTPYTVKGDGPVADTRSLSMNW